MALSERTSRVEDDLIRTETATAAFDIVKLNIKSSRVMDNI